MRGGSPDSIMKEYSPKPKIYTYDPDYQREIVCVHLIELGKFLVIGISILDQGFWGFAQNPYVGYEPCIVVPLNTSPQKYYLRGLEPLLIRLTK